MNRLIPFWGIILFALMSVAGIQPKQQGLILLHADKSVSTKGPNGVVRDFTGHVHFQQDTLEMFCQRAIYYAAQKKIRFSDSVRIYNGSQSIFADLIDYYPDSKQAVCSGNVRISTRNDSISCDFLTYNFKTDRVTAKGNVYLLNREERVQITGQRGWHVPDSGLSRVRGNARFVRVDSSGRDTLTITATVLSYHKNKKTFALATDSVVIHQNAMRAVCDSAYYFPDSEFIRLKKNPHVWYEENELQGNSMLVTLDSLEIKTIRIKGNGTAQSVADSVKGLINRLKGKIIDFDIEQRKPRLITATGNASSIYYLENDQGEYQGANYATADTIRIFFAGGKLDSITIIGGARGIYYPENYQGEMKFAE